MEPRVRTAAGTGSPAGRLVLLVLLLTLTGASPGGSPRVGTLVEGWFDSTSRAADVPDCPVPDACPDLPSLSESYPEDTLHVGTRLGRTTAFTAFSLDRGSLPGDAVISGGTLILPVAGADAGTQAPEVAELAVCLLASPAVAAEGAPSSQGPRADCDVSSAATYDADRDPPVFRADLAPFAAAWREGAPTFGLAVVPDPEAETPLPTWRVAFHGRDREAPDARPIRARLILLSSGPAGAAPGFQPDPPAPGTPAEAGGPLPAPPDTQAAPPQPALPVAPDEPIAAAPRAAEVQPVPATAPLPDLPPFLSDNPAVWALPLVALLCVGMLRHSLVRPVPSPAAAGGSHLRALFLGTGPARTSPLLATKERP